MRLLTFDIEDWFHILEHEPTADVHAWPQFESRVRRGTERILEALAVHRQRATFFCLGWVAERCPALVRAIDEAGHEVGTHSYAHEMVHQLTPAAFEADLARSIGIISELTGKPVTSYRAPGFSITAGTPWAFESLVRAGIENDASLFPTWRMHGGFRGAMREPGWIETPSGRLREFPMSLSTAAELPVAGGGYFRLFPSRLIHALIRREPYVMTYFHPRDFDAEQPTIPGLSTLRYLRSYVGVPGGFAKFERLLRAFEFADLREAVKRIDWSCAPRMRRDSGREGGWEVVPASPDADGKGLRLTESA